MNTKLSRFVEKSIIALGFIIPLLVTLNRFVIPDIAYDDINYHLIAGLRGWQGSLVAKYEFYPLVLRSFFPGLEMLNEVGRNLLGYRLGTLTQLFFYWGTFILLIKSIKKLEYSTGSRVIDAIIITASFLSMEALFQLGTYYVDVINAFFFTLFVYVFIRFLIDKKSVWIYTSSTIMGLLILFKYTNYVFIIPYFILLLVLYKQKTIDSRILIFQYLIIGVISIPWFVITYGHTGNPLFPYFNSIFKSPYFPPTSFAFDQGPQSMVDRIIYPALMMTGSAKLTHSIIPDYRLIFYFISSFLSLLVLQKMKEPINALRLLIILFLLTFIIWMNVFGYSRYVIGLEYLGGIILIGCLGLVHERNRITGLVFSLLCAIFLLYQVVVTGAGSIKYDMSWRPNFAHNGNTYLTEINNLFVNEYYYPNRDEIDFFLSCGSPDTGYIVPSNLNDLPIVNFSDNNWGFTPYLRKAISTYIEKYGYKERYRFVAVIKESGMDSNLEKCKATFSKIDIDMGSLQRLNIPFLGYKNMDLSFLQGEIDLSFVLSNLKQ